MSGHHKRKDNHPTGTIGVHRYLSNTHLTRRGTGLKPLVEYHVHGSYPIHSIRKDKLNGDQGAADTGYFNTQFITVTTPVTH